MRKRWHYLYVIFYPALDFKCYYGSRITAVTPDEDIEYFGSSVTFAHYNDPTQVEYQADALKVIIWAQQLPNTKKSGKLLADLETKMIKQALAESGAELCLNRNYAGRIVLTPAEKKVAWEKSVQNGGGFLNMSKRKQSKWAAIGGLKSLEQGKGIHGMSEESLREARAKGNKVISEKYAKTYTFKSPTGEIVTFKNLRAFCRDNNLQASHMRSLNIGKLRSHKGWRRPEE
jgi:hypothetical protein